MTNLLDNISQEKVYTVSKLNQEVKQLLHRNFSTIVLEGEITNWNVSQKDHWYFALKDKHSELRMVMFKEDNLCVSFSPQDGDFVRLCGKVSIYEQRGQYQFIARSVQLAGTGDLLQQFEQLKKKLDQEGLFALERKKKLPALAHHIAVITSPSGAVIEDIKSIIKRRFAAMKLSIIGVQVQGKYAANAVIRALSSANTMQCDPPIDVILIARGGGSAEDLSAFNDEAMARAVAESRLPTVSAIGHEVDFTIIDLVADYRAPTPSAAAEHLTPDKNELKQSIQDCCQRMIAHTTNNLHRQNEKLNNYRHGLRHPKEAWQTQTQLFDEYIQRFSNSFERHLHLYREQLRHYRLRLKHPEPLWRQQKEILHTQIRSLRRSTLHRMQYRTAQLIQYKRELTAVSPQATLQRGYSVVLRSDGAIIRQPSDVAINESVRARLARGEICLRVTSKK